MEVGKERLKKKGTTWTGRKKVELKEQASLILFFAAMRKIYYSATSTKKKKNVILYPLQISLINFNQFS